MAGFSPPAAGQTTLPSSYRERFGFDDRGELALTMKD
jgi:bifunctional DNA-binding transcriptional regulator/antitoxin component of YhaV-PrlF toxin-antitoxin module